MNTRNLRLILNEYINNSGLPKGMAKAEIAVKAKVSVPILDRIVRDDYKHDIKASTYLRLLLAAGLTQEEALGVISEVLVESSLGSDSLLEDSEVPETA